MINKNKIIVNSTYCVMYLYNRKQEKIRETIFDKVYLLKVKKFRWSAYKHRNTYYVVTNLNKEQQKAYKKKRLKLHQLVLSCAKRFIIDHKNHNGLDNRLDNLRIVTNRTNCENKIRKNKTGYTGVSWHKRDNIWACAIQINGKNKHLGNYKTKEEAHQARELYKLTNKL